MNYNFTKLDNDSWLHVLSFLDTNTQYMLQLAKPPLFRNISQYELWVAAYDQLDYEYEEEIRERRYDCDYEEEFRECGYDNDYEDELFLGEFV